MKIKIKSWQIAAALVIIIFGGIFLSQQLGWWKTSGSKTPATIKSGEYAGTADPMDIRGSYAFTDIAKSFNIPLADLAAAYQLTDAQASTFKCKDLEGLGLGEPGQDIGTESVRTFVAFYIGRSPGDFSPGDLPQSAISVLLAKGQLSADARTYLENFKK
jgi:hypothetical protein